PGRIRAPRRTGQLAPARGQELKTTRRVYTTPRNVNDDRSRYGGPLAASGRFDIRHGLIDQEAPQAHAEEEAQEAAEEDPLATSPAGQVGSGRPIGAAVSRSRFARFKDRARLRREQSRRAKRNRRSPPPPRRA